MIPTSVKACALSFAIIHCFFDLIQLQLKQFVVMEIFETQPVHFKQPILRTIGYRHLTMPVSLTHMYISQFRDAVVQTIRILIRVMSFVSERQNNKLITIELIICELNVPNTTKTSASSQIKFHMRGPLTHWGRATHICVSKLSIIGSDNGLSPARRQANAGILLIRPLGTNINEILIEIRTFSFKKMHSKMSSEKWRPFVSVSMC